MIELNQDGERKMLDDVAGEKAVDGSVRQGAHVLEEVGLDYLMPAAAALGGLAGMAVHAGGNPSHLTQHIQEFSSAAAEIPDDRSVAKEGNVEAQNVLNAAARPAELVLEAHIVEGLPSVGARWDP